MTDNNLKNLPLGTSDFAALRLANEIYVDRSTNWLLKDANIFWLVQEDLESLC